jgi:glycosyltransferase involved in cell wall biosynthesis
MFRSRPRNLIVNSAAVEEELVKRAGIPRDKIRVIENALDASRFVPYKSERVEDLRARNGMDGGTFLILSVGRIHRQKNIICTLKALARLKRSRPDARLTFLHMGFRQSSQVYGEISAFIEKNNMGGMCRFMDPVHGMMDFYNMADAVVIPSLWEGLPNVVLEAMSCGRITIIAESADNDGIVEDGVTGFKFKTNDDVGLCRVLERVMDMDEDRERLMARRARRRVTDRFSIRRMVEKFQDLYETV